MQIDSNTLRVYHRKLSTTTLGAVLCLACSAGLAAEPARSVVKTFSTSLPDEKSPGLKLDLGPAMSDDDCEEDYADLMDAAATGGSRPPGAGAAAASAAAAGAGVAAAAIAGAGTAGTAGTAGAGVRAVSAVSPAVAGQAGTAGVPGPAAHSAVSAAVAAPVPVPPVPPAPAWEVTLADKTLNTVLARWAAAAGWQLVWELPVDYAVSVRTEVRGTFAEAVGAVAKSMATAEMPMKAIFYEGNRVLRIVAKGTD